MNLTFTALDIETTGLSPEKDKIIEIGAVAYKDGKVVKTFSKFIHPGIPIPEKITELTGITDEMLKGAGSEREVIEEFLAFVDTDVILGHNVAFDFSFIKTAAVKYGYSFEKKAFDTLLLSREFHRELPSKSLESMCTFYQVENKRSHRAYHDAVASADIFFKLIEDFYEGAKESFKERPLHYQPKKQEPMTAKQKKYLMDLVNYHKIELKNQTETLSKSEASRLIDKIILKHGMILRA